MSRQSPNGTYWKKRALKAEELLKEATRLLSLDGAIFNPDSLIRKAKAHLQRNAAEE